MAINFSLKSENAVAAITDLDGALDSLLGKFTNLNLALKTLSVGQTSKKINELSLAMSDMQGKTSVASEKLDLQAKKSDKLKEQVKSLTKELKKLQKTQESGNKSTQKEIDLDSTARNAKNALILKVKLLNLESNKSLEVQRAKVISAQLELQSQDKQAKKVAEFNLLLGRKNDLTQALTRTEQLRLEMAKQEQAAQEKLLQTKARLINIIVRGTEVEQISNDQKLRARILTAKNNQVNLKRIALAELDLKVATEQAAAWAKKKRGIVEETRVLSKNTAVKTRAVAKTRELNTALADGNRHAAEFRAALSALGVSFGIFTGSTILAATAIFATVRALRAAVQAGAEFEFTMDRVNAVMNTTGAESIALDARVRDLAKTTIFTAGEVSKGLVFLGMAGFQTGEALQALEPTLRLAQIGMIDMERAADLVTNIMAGFDIQANQVSETVDKLSVVVTSSNTSITQLAQALSFVGPAAANTNTTLEETTAILGFFGNVGIKATRAGTALRRGIANLSNPTEKVLKVMGDLEITITAVDGRMRSMADIIKDLHREGATMAQIFRVFGARAGPAFASAIIRGTDSIDDLIKAQKTAIGTSKALASILADNAYTEFKLVISAAEEAFISFYSTINDPLRSALRGLANTLNAMAPLMPLLGTGLTVATVAAGSLGAALLLLKLAAFARETTLAYTAVAIFTGHATRASVATFIWAGATATLGRAVVFLTGPIVLVTVAITALGLAYVFSRSKSELLVDALREQRDAIEEINKIRSVAGLDIESTGNRVLDEEIRKFKELQDLVESEKGPTLFTQLKETVNKASQAVVEYEDELKRLRQEPVLVDGVSFNDLGVAKELIAVAEEALRVRQGTLRVAEASVQSAEKIVVLAKIKNAHDLTGLQFNKAFRDSNKAEAKLKDDEARKDRVELTLAQKMLAIGRERVKTQEISARGKKTIAQLEEKQRKFDIANQLRSLKVNVGEDSAILENINRTFALRLQRIKILKSKEDAIISARNIRLDKFQFSTQQTDQLTTALAKGLDEGATDKKEIKRLEDHNKERLALLQTQAQDEEKVNQIRVNNRISVNKLYFSSQFEIDNINREKLLSQQIKGFEREKDALNFSLDNRKVSLEVFARETIALDNAITQSRIGAVREQIGVLLLHVDSLNRQKAALIAERESIEDLQKVINAYNSEVTKLTQSELVLQNARKTGIDQADITIDKLRDFVLKGNKANISLATQLDLLQKGESASKDATQQMFKYAIAQAVAAQTTGKNSVELKLLLGDLDELSEAYDKMKRRINETEEAWDNTVTSMKGKARSAAESMQDSFTTFFLNPTKDGLDDLLNHFTQTIAKMAAERLTAQLFDKDKGGLGPMLTNLFGGKGLSSGDNSAIDDKQFQATFNDSNIGLDLFADNNDLFADSLDIFGLSSQSANDAAFNLFDSADATALAAAMTNKGALNTIVGALGLTTSATTTSLSASMLSTSAVSLTSAAASLTLAASALTVSAGASAGSSLLSGVAGAVAGGKAAGGPVIGNVPYLVGEKGPEIFVPAGSGNIVPNNKISRQERSGSKTVFYNTINITTGESNEGKIRGIVQDSMDQLEGKLARQQQRSQRVVGIR